MAEVEATGHDAKSVLEIPPRGWWAILKRTAQQFSADNVTLLAGGIAFFMLLAIFPALASFVALAGLLIDPNTIAGELQGLSGVLPEAAVSFVTGELTRIASTGDGTLGVSFAVGLGLSLWSANAGVKAIFSGLNVVHGESETRGFFRLTALSLAFTVAAIAGAVLLIAAVAIVPAVLHFLPLGGAADDLVALLRWPLLLVAVLGGITALFKYGAARTPPRLGWVIYGAALTAIVWVIVSAGFSYYLANFGNYNVTYGTLGTAIGVMMWLYISLVVLLAGAELNSEIEHQVTTDTTVGPEKPLGERDARMADSVAQS